MTTNKFHAISPISQLMAAYQLWTGLIVVIFGAGWQNVNAWNYLRELPGGPTAIGCVGILLGFGELLSVVVWRTKRSEIYRQIGATGFALSGVWCAALAIGIGLAYRATDDISPLSPNNYLFIAFMFFIQSALLVTKRESL